MKDCRSYSSLVAVHRNSPPRPRTVVHRLIVDSGIQRRYKPVGVWFGSEKVSKSKAEHDEHGDTKCPLFKHHRNLGDASLTSAAPHTKLTVGSRVTRHVRGISSALDGSASKLKTPDYKDHAACLFGKHLQKIFFHFLHSAVWGSGNSYPQIQDNLQRFSCMDFGARQFARGKIKLLTTSLGAQ